MAAYRFTSKRVLKMPCSSINKTWKLYPKSFKCLWAAWKLFQSSFLQKNGSTCSSSTSFSMRLPFRGFKQELKVPNKRKCWEKLVSQRRGRLPRTKKRKKRKILSVFFLDLMILGIKDPLQANYPMIIPWLLYWINQVKILIQIVDLIKKWKLCKVFRLTQMKHKILKNSWKVAAILACFLFYRKIAKFIQFYKFPLNLKILYSPKWIWKLMSNEFKS